MSNDNYPLEIYPLRLVLVGAIIYSVLPGFDSQFERTRLYAWTYTSDWFKWSVKVAGVRSGICKSLLNKLFHTQLFQTQLFQTK